MFRICVLCLVTFLLIHVTSASVNHSRTAEAMLLHRSNTRGLNTTGKTNRTIEIPNDDYYDHYDYDLSSAPKIEPLYILFLCIPFFPIVLL